MRRPSRLWLWSLPLTLLGGCLLPSFENVSAPAAQAGADSGGEPNSVGGAGGGEAPLGGAPVGGTGTVVGAMPAPVADTYVVRQGRALTVKVAEGVLANDKPADLSVTGFSDTDPARPKDFDAVLEIAADGSLSFEPAAGFFGRYQAEYTVENAAGDSATASVTFIVQPVGVDLTAVGQGIGGVTLVGSATDGVGAALAALGDVNDDGFDDFAIGAPGALAGNGSIYVVFGRADFSALTLGALAASSKEERFAVLAGSAANPLGDYVSSAGLFDSDKRPDILVGSPTAALEAGALFVVYGGAALKRSLQLDALPDGRGIAISGDYAGQQLGLHVAGGADFNGDSKADLLTGLYPNPANPTHGGVGTVVENPVQSQALSATKYAAIKDTSVFKLPQSLAVAGDVNDDGKDDWLATSTRNVALVFGQGDDSLPALISELQTSGKGILRTRVAGATGVAAVASAADVNGDKAADFSYCDEFQAGVSCEVFFGPIAANAGLANGDWRLSGFTTTLAQPRLGPAADLNQDGFADLLVSDDSGAYVVFGRDAGFGAVDVTSLGTDGFSLGAPTVGSLAALSTLGDVNGDGYADFAIGEPSAAGGAGYVYVVFGGPFGADQR
jgi:hypothetical protein